MRIEELPGVVEERFDIILNNDMRAIVRDIGTYATGDMVVFISEKKLRRCYRVITHEAELSPQHALFSMRPLTNLEKVELPKSEKE